MPVGGVAQTIAEEIEGQDDQDDRYGRDEQPGESATVCTFCACCRSTPQLMAGGRKPRPRKLSAVSPMTIAGSASVVAAMMWLRKSGTDEDGR